MKQQWWEESEKRKSQTRESQEKSCETLRFLQCFVALEGRKVGSLKRRVRMLLIGWQINNCTLLWCEAHFEEMLKTPQPWSYWKLRSRKSARTPLWRTLGRFWKSKGWKRLSLRALLEVEMLKKCMRLSCEAHFEVNSVKHRWSQTAFGRWDVEKVHGVVARRTFRSQISKSAQPSDHFWALSGVFVPGAMDSTPLQNWARCVGFLTVSKTMAGVGRLRGICTDEFRVAGVVQYKRHIHQTC